MNTKEKWLIPLGMWLVFEIVAVTGRTIYAGLSWLNMSGEHADRRLLVLSVHWCF